MKKLFLIVGILCLTISLSAQSKLSNLTRSFLSQRKAQQQEQSMYTRHLVKSTVKVAGAETIQVFVHFYDKIDIDLLASYDAVVTSKFERSAIVVASVPVDNLEALSQETSIKYVEVGTPVYDKLDRARVSAHVNEIHQGLAPLKQPYTGKNVIVGAVDRGFHYTHPAFYTPGGELRIKRAWIQSGSGTTIIGDKLETSEDIENKVIDFVSDDTGHGTHVMGIAAGSNQDGNNPYYGVAIESDLVMVSYSDRVDNSVSVAEGLKYIFDYAESVGKPAVANLSLGSHYGPHDGTSTLDVIMDEMVAPGRLIVGAAGNEGADKMHISKTFSESDTLLRSMIKYTKTMSVVGGNYHYPVPVEIWSDKEFKFRVVAYNAGFNYNRKKYVYASDFVNVDETLKSSMRISPVFEYEGELVISTNVEITFEKSPLNDKYHLSMECKEGTVNDPRVFLGIEFVSEEGTLHAWADERFGEFTNNNVSGWEIGNTSSTIGEVGGTANRIITVGSYVTYVAPGMDKYSTEGDLSSFSSKGPTADGRVKPDITAPGEKIASAVPGTKAVQGGSSFDKVSEVEFDGDIYFYSRMQGTSMATPMVTGTIATWLEAVPDLTYEQVIEAFSKTANRDQFYGTEVPNNHWGIGKLDAYEGLLYVLGLTTSVPDIDTPSSMLLYPNPSCGAFNIGFIRNDENVTVSVYGMNGQLVYFENIGEVHSGSDREILLESVQNGAYVVKVQGNLANETFRLLVVK